MPLVPSTVERATGSELADDSRSIGQRPSSAE